MVKIYTKTGDKGTTSLFGGKRVLKSDLKVEAYGLTDEFNSLIGVIISLNQKSKIKNQKYISKIKNELKTIQKDLFEIGSALAYQNAIYDIQNTKYLKARAGEFEKLIDKLTKELPEIRNFILPGGGEIGSMLHFGRSICRRTERKMVQLSQKENVPQEIIIYLNRLSDLLFTMARFINYKEGHKETVWFKNG